VKLTVLALATALNPVGKPLDAWMLYGAVPPLMASVPS
jgi:hypothetical protein